MLVSWQATPPVSVTAGWHERKKVIVKHGLDAPGIDQSLRLYDTYLGKMETSLAENHWIAGDAYSLADIGLVPYVNRLDMMNMSAMWTRSRPRVTDWFERVKAMPTFKPQMLDWVPADLHKGLGDIWGSELAREVDQNPARRLIGATNNCVCFGCRLDHPAAMSASWRNDLVVA